MPHPKGDIFRAEFYGRSIVPILAAFFGFCLLCGILFCLAGCQSRSGGMTVIREAPTVASDVPNQKDAYWRNQYRKNRPVPPDTYQVFPKPPRNNQFGEFDDTLQQGLDRQPGLPALPADAMAASMSSGMPAAGFGSGLSTAPGTWDRVGTPAARPVAAAGAASGITVAGGHFYPMEQLVYGGDYPDIDKPEMYRLMPKDVVTVTVRDHPEFSGQLEIQPDGTVRIPNAHDLVRLRGLTVEAAADELQRTLSPYVRGECQVRVQANRARGGYYFVFGDVLQPGRFPMGMEPIRLTDAVLAANWEANPARRDADGDELGPSFPAASPRGRYVAPPTADLARVLLVTPHRSRPVRVQYDVRSAMLGVNAQDPAIRPGQIVVVPSLDPNRNRELGLEQITPGVPTTVAAAPARGFADGNASPRLPEVAPDPLVDVPTVDSWSVSAVDANMTAAFDSNLNTATNGPMRRATVYGAPPDGAAADDTAARDAPAHAAGKSAGGWSKGL